MRPAKANGPTGVLAVIVVLAMGAGALAQTSGGGQDMASDKKGAGAPVEIQTLAMTAAATANVWRIEAGTDIDNAMANMSTPEAKSKWDKCVISLYFADSKIQLHDFFCGAVILVGRVTAERQVVAFYNPWVDAILLTAWSGIPDKPLITDFHFVSGEGWRGKTVETPEDVLGWYASKDAVRLSLAKCYSSAVALFSERYPLTGEFVLLTDDLKKNAANQVEQLAVIKARMIARIKIYQQWFAPENRAILKRVDAIMKLMRGKQADGLKAALAKDQDAGVLSSIFLLPEEIKDRFAPIFFMYKDNYVEVGLVSAYGPRWFVMLDMDMAKPESDQISLQLFDLELSGKYVEIAAGGRK